jgi:hypothetical protein
VLNYLARGTWRARAAFSMSSAPPETIVRKPEKATSVCVGVVQVEVVLVLVEKVG